MISEYATAAGSHFSIDVAVGNESLATEQLIVDGIRNTSIGVNASTGAVRTWTMTCRTAKPLSATPEV